METPAGCAAHEEFVIQRVWEASQQAETAPFPRMERSSFRMCNTQALLATMVAAWVVARHMHCLRILCRIRYNKYISWKSFTLMPLILLI